MKLIGTGSVLITALLLSACGHGIDSGTGKKIGQVIQLGKHGLLNSCQTYEGKMVRGGLNTGSGVQGGVFEFTVEGDDLYNRLQKAMEAQQEIEVSYQKVSMSGACTCESDHFIRDFRVMAETTPTLTVKTPSGNATDIPGTVSDKERKLHQLLHEILTEK
jgi:hypothetical protein